MKYYIAHKFNNTYIGGYDGQNWYEYLQIINDELLRINITPRRIGGWTWNGLSFFNDIKEIKEEDINKYIIKHIFIKKFNSFI